MAKLSMCHAMIKVDEYTIIARGETNPINYAEVEMCLFQLGERAVTDLVVVDEIDAENSEVLTDLRLKYGNGAVQKAFPGVRPRLPMQAPSDVPNIDDVPEPAKKPRKSRAKSKPTTRAATRPKVEAENAQAEENDTVLSDMLAGADPE